LDDNICHTFEDMTISGRIAGFDHRRNEITVFEIAMLDSLVLAAKNKHICTFLADHTLITVKLLSWLSSVRLSVTNVL